MPLAGALLGWRSFLEALLTPQLPDLALEQPRILWGISNTLFLAQTPGWGPLATANLAVLFFMNFGYPLLAPPPPLSPPFSRKVISTLLNSRDLAPFRPDLRRLFQPLRTNVYK